MGNEMMVSVCMITYNHVLFIRQAVEGVMCQQVDFDIELIIGEDCSTDNTREICRELQQKYPGRIKLLLPEHNLGVGGNLIATLNAARGKYIALCEGDDFWTDPLKLQKQVCFLEANPTVGLVHSNVVYVDNFSQEIEPEPFYLNMQKRIQNGCIFFDYLSSRRGYILTVSVLFRRHLLDMNNLPWFIYDHWIFAEIARKSEVSYFPDKLVAYRRHNMGITNTNFDFIKIRYSYVFLDLLYKYLHNESENIKQFDSWHEKKIIAYQYYTMLYYFIRNNWKGKKILWDILKLRMSILMYFFPFLFNNIVRYIVKLIK